ncbi:MAG: glycoside hydrolase family 3 N-terminal domain-containing protein, partial [Candidatus Zixiibacteriota bacterium]
MNDLKYLNKLGQIFMIGFKGISPSDEFLGFLKEEQIGGVILFEENCPNYDTLKYNISRIKSCYKSKAPFIAIDQEGGRVSRIRGIPAEIHAASYYGSKNLLERFTEDYTHSALYMESVGISLNLAPVADIFLNTENNCLRDRCFSGDFQQVAKFVEKSVEIARHCGLLSCLKHFPGLGAAENDPHDQVAEASYDEKLWKEREKIPFLAGVRKGAEMIMTTHLRVPEIDDNIVTESEKIVNKLIRKELGFEGPVMTDSLVMKGAAGLGEPGEKAVKAFNAGHDILLFGQDLEENIDAF